MTITDQEVSLLWAIIRDTARTYGPGQRIGTPVLSSEMIAEREAAEPIRLQLEAEMKGQEPKGVRRGGGRDKEPANRYAGTDAERPPMGRL